MFGLRTSRFYENINNNKIALNLFQGDIKDFNENDEFEDILTKRGKVKNKSKIEYFKNYINNFKEIKFKTARQIEIFRKKENKIKKEIKDQRKKEDLNIIKEEQDNSINKFNLIKETIQEGIGAQKENMNSLLNKKKEISIKTKKNKKEISNKIIKNNEDILNKIKNNKNKTKILEKEKDKMKKKIMKLKEKDKNKNLSTGKVLEIFDKGNEKFLKLIKGKKIGKIKKKLNISFQTYNFYRNDKYFYNEDKIEILRQKTISNEKRKLKQIRNKYNMKIIGKNIISKNMDNIIEKEIFNIKCKNRIKQSKYLSKSCSNKKEQSKNIENASKICKNQRQNIKKRATNISDNI